MKIPALSLLLAIFVFDAPLWAQSPTRPAGVELRDPDAREAAQDGHEVSECMAQLGVDYPVLLQTARSGEPSVLSLFIWLGHHAPLDGAAAESYSYDLNRLATKVGDEKFAAAMIGQNRDVLNACYWNLCSEYTQEDPETRKAADDVSVALPVTMEAIRQATIADPLWK